MEMMGGIAQVVLPKETIVLKPNLLQITRPERAVTTHPSLVVAVGRIAKNAGARPIIADSPGSGLPNTRGTFKRLYQTCGMMQAAEEAGIEVNWDTGFQHVSFLDGKLIKHFEVITPILRANGVINLCKLKTHSFTAMTGAVKNLFGAICGYAKPGYHAKLRDAARFAGMLLDLADFLSPRVSIMDAVVGMEGEGPSAGTPRQVGLLLASADPLALDVVAGEVMGIPREHNPELMEAERRGVAPTRMEEIDLFGLDKSQLRVSGFKLPRTLLAGPGFGRMPDVIAKLAQAFLQKAATLEPEIQKDRCNACGVCQQACPMQVISIIGGRHAEINHKDCIRCYCCHEVCPESAVELRGSLLYRLLNRGVGS